MTALVISELYYNIGYESRLQVTHVIFSQMSAVALINAPPTPLPPLPPPPASQVKVHHLGYSVKQAPPCMAPLPLN